MIDDLWQLFLTVGGMCWCPHTYNVNRIKLLNFSRLFFGRAKIWHLHMTACQECVATGIFQLVIGKKFANIFLFFPIRDRMFLVNFTTQYAKNESQIFANYLAGNAVHNFMPITVSRERIRLCHRLGQIEKLKIKNQNEPQRKATGT